MVQEQVEPQELGERDVKKVMKDLQNGNLPAIDKAAHDHVVHVTATGVAGGPHIAINGKLHGVEANPMVWLCSRNLV